MQKPHACLIGDSFMGLYTQGEGSKYRSTLGQKVLSRSFCVMSSRCEEREEPHPGLQSRSGLPCLLLTLEERALSFQHGGAPLACLLALSRQSFLLLLFN